MTTRRSHNLRIVMLIAALGLGASNAQQQPATPPAPSTPPQAPPTTPPTAPPTAPPDVGPGAPAGPVDPKQLEEDLRRRMDEIRRKSGLPPSQPAPGAPGSPLMPGVPGLPAGVVAEPGPHISPPKPPPPPPMSPEEYKKAWTKAISPGDAHAKLVADLAGTWNVTLKLFGEPGAPPQQSVGTAVMTPILGGRYVRAEITAKLPEALGGGDFQGVGITGYNNALGKYESTWIDNQGTGVLISTGVAADDGSITYSSEQADPVTAQKRTFKTIEHYTKDSIVSENYEIGPGGQQIKSMVVEYARAAPAAK